MIGTNFPISEYYRDHILDARTISRGGNWWTAVLLISDPKTNKPFLAIYKWQHTETGWKTRQRFIFRKKQDVTSVFESVTRLSEQLE